jgi:hypothetical protein
MEKPPERLLQQFHEHTLCSPGLAVMPLSDGISLGNWAISQLASLTRCSDPSATHFLSQALASFKLLPFRLLKRVPGHAAAVDLPLNLLNALLYRMS